MEPLIPLSTWFEAYLYHHRTLNRSPKTIAHYEATFKLLSRYLDAQGLRQESPVLTSAQMKHFAIWLRETPIRQRRGRRNARWLAFTVSSRTCGPFFAGSTMRVCSSGR